MNTRENSNRDSVDVHRLVRPLPSSGEADCPQCGAVKSVKRHNADWNCHKCGFCEVVDPDREAEQCKLCDGLGYYEGGIYAGEDCRICGANAKADS